VAAPTIIAAVQAATMAIRQAETVSVTFITSLWQKGWAERQSPRVLVNNAFLVAGLFGRVYEAPINSLRNRLYYPNVQEISDTDEEGYAGMGGKLLRVDFLSVAPGRSLP
jgi:hypothetical protein